jgi:hypothetical protein
MWAEKSWKICYFSNNSGHALPPSELSAVLHLEKGGRRA